MRRVLRKLLQLRLSDEQRERQLHRILFVETNIMLPVKLAAIVGAIYLYRLEGAGMVDILEPKEVSQAYFTQLRFYAAGNIVFWICLLAARLGRVWPGVLRFSAFSLVLLDGLFLSGLIYFTGRLDSVLYWLYIGLLIRSAVNFPLFWRQFVLTLATCAFYTIAVAPAEQTLTLFSDELYWMRIAILMLVGLCCWGAYALLEREQRRAQAAQEFQFRAGKLAATGHLAAEIAHQLKNPLGIINNAAYLLQRRIASNEPVPAEIARVIRDEVARSDRILSELMNYARLSEGRIERVNVNDLLEQALGQVLPDSLQSGVRVEKDLAEALPRLAVQRAQLEDCFVNIIKNAVEAMDGRGTLTVRSRYAGDGVIGVEIGDTGHGIPPEVLPRVFEAFFTTKEKGTGLGLAIAKNVIESYDGRISISSNGGTGTLVSVRLPIGAMSLR